MKCFISLWLISDISDNGAVVFKFSFSSWIYCSRIVISRNSKMLKQFAISIYIAFSTFCFHTTTNLFKHKTLYYYMLFIVLMQ